MQNSQRAANNNSTRKWYKRPEWWALIVSVAALLVAGLSGVASYKQSVHARSVQSAATIDRFIDQGATLRRTPSCYTYALAMRDDDLRSAFAATPRSVPIITNELSNLSACIDLETGPNAGVLEGRDLDNLTFKLLRKMDSYEAIFEAHRDGNVETLDVCNTVWTSFEQGAKSFLLRIHEMAPKPEKLASLDKNFSAALDAIEGSICP